jgi:hypothetical protein
MPDEDMNLDVDFPDKVSAVLRNAANAYRDSQSALNAAWQDDGAGKPWQWIATILDRAATSIDAKLKKEGF